jgi:hypothetical protein
MRGQDVRAAGFCRGLPEQPIARAARSLLQSGFWFCAAPAQNAMCDPEATG